MRYERAVKALDDHVAYYGRGAAAEAALGALARIGHPSSVSLFWSLLSDKDAGIRQHAVEGIGRVGDPSRAGELESAMAHERSDRAELAVVFALQRLGRGQRVDRLVEAVSHSAMREQARGYLIELGPPNAQALTAYLRDPTPDLRAVIADILGRIGDSTIIPALEPLTRDRDPQVAVAAERAVARLSRK
jgi:HEAT repeat protein